MTVASALRSLLLVLLALPALADLPPVAAFATLPKIADPALSPSGRYVAAKLFNGQQYLLVIFDLEKPGDRKDTVIATGNMEVNWLHWKSDDRLLVSLWFVDRRWGTPTRETRLFSMRPDGSDQEQLVRPRRLGSSKTEYEVPVQFGDRVVSFLPDDPKHVLLAFNVEDPRFPRVYKVDIEDDSRELVQAGVAGIQSWTADGAGRVRVGEGVSGDTMTTKIVMKKATGGDWTTFRDVPLDTEARFSPVAFDPDDADILYVLSAHEDGDTTGLYRFRMSTGSFTDRLYRNPGVDIADWTFDPAGRKLVGVSYILDFVQHEWFDPRPRDIMKTVADRVDARNLSIASASIDYRRVLLYGESPDLPPRYYLYEPGNGALRYFTKTNDALEARTLGGMAQTRFKARDGLEIPAYLTLPPGLTKKPAKPLPAIIFPHGGPAARDMAGFDPWVQLFASRGYVVMQLNFRGSWGYGDDFKAAGHRQWGQAMQDDVTDGTRWLVEQGFADPARICIVGGSYGGYAALMGAVKEPGLYRCAASVAGVSDLRALVMNFRQYWNGRVGTRFIGEAFRDRQSLDANSPVNRAADIRIPVYLAHGTVDRSVPPVQSRDMAKALKAAGRNFEYHEIEDADHFFLRGDQRVQLLETLDAFLRRNLGPP